MRELVVRLQGRTAGVLADDGGRMTFRYDAAWAADPAAPTLSLAMPPRPEPYGDDACRAFFGGLLPEGAVRDHLARRFGISPGNEFSLLERVGGDCAGAVTLREPGASAEERRRRSRATTGSTTRRSPPRSPTSPPARWASTPRGR